MVHLGQVATDKEIEDKSNVNVGVQELGIDDSASGQFSTSVYGSRYAAFDLPRHEMPEDEMPKEIAYRMIKDDLTLDGTPTLK